MSSVDKRFSRAVHEERRRQHQETRRVIALLDELYGRKPKAAETEHRAPEQEQT